MHELISGEIVSFVFTTIEISQVSKLPIASSTSHSITSPLFKI